MAAEVERFFAQADVNERGVVGFDAWMHYALLQAFFMAAGRGGHCDPMTSVAATAIGVEAIVASATVTAVGSRLARPHWSPGLTQHRMYNA